MNLNLNLKRLVRWIPNELELERLVRWIPNELEI